MALRIFDGVVNDTQIAVEPDNISHYEVFDVSAEPWSTLYMKDDREFNIKGNILEIFDIVCAKEEKAITDLLNEVTTMSFVQIQDYFADCFKSSRLKQGLTNLIDSGKIEITLERRGSMVTKYFELKK